MRGGKPTPGKLTSITALAHDALSIATDGYDEWTGLLRTMSRNYKYDFADQELLPPELPIPVYRTESRADFERGLRFDERNRYITDYLTAELNDDAHEYVWSVLTPEDRAQISAWLRAARRYLPRSRH